MLNHTRTKLNNVPSEAIPKRRIISRVNEDRPLHDEQFSFRTRFSTTRYPANPWKKSAEMSVRLTGAVSLDMPKPLTHILLC
jgi:hypothetical protein